MEQIINSPKHGKHILLFDEGDSALIKKYKWGVAKRKKTIYAFAYIASRKQILLHALLLNPPKGKRVDHIDGNGLNNCRENLRIVEGGQNEMNVGLRSSNTTGYKGVSFNKHANKFVVSIKIKYRQIHGGLFLTKEVAARRYNELAIEHHGQYAKLNQIPIEI